MMILRPSTQRNEGHGGELVHDVFVFFVKNDVRIGGALFVWCTCKYLRLKYVNRFFCNDIFGRARDFAKTSRKGI